VLFSVIIFSAEFEIWERERERERERLRGRELEAIHTIDSSGYYVGNGRDTEKTIK